MTKVADWLVSLGVETEDVDWSIDKFGPEIAQCQSMKESSLNVESQTVGPSTSSWKPWRTWEFRNGVKMKTTPTTVTDWLGLVVLGLVILHLSHFMS